MKMSKTSYALLKTHISAFVAKDREHVVNYRKQLKSTGDVDMLFRWNLMWASVPSDFVSNTLYPEGLNDDHIDTALKAITIELGLGPDHFARAA